MIEGKKSASSEVWCACPAPPIVPNSRAHAKLGPLVFPPSQWPLIFFELLRQLLKLRISGAQGVIIHLLNMPVQMLITRAAISNS